MKRLLPAALSLCTLAGALTMAQAPTADRLAQIEVVSQHARAVNAGAPGSFTGHVQVEQLFAARGGRSMSGGSVTFKPGARSVWHRHPAGQILIITAGTGLIQQWGNPILTIKAGDIVWIPPGVKHWHGSTPTTSMTHIAIQEAVEGKVVDWMEPVSDEQYAASTPEKQ